VQCRSLLPQKRERTEKKKASTSPPNLEIPCQGERRIVMIVIVAFLALFAVRGKKRREINAVWLLQYACNLPHGKLVSMNHVAEEDLSLILTPSAALDDHIALESVPHRRRGRDAVENLALELELLDAAAALATDVVADLDEAEDVLVLEIVL
jgi:hypothetical protein